MSELRAYRIKGNTLGDFDDVYIKSEADKVIAELEESHKMEVEQLLIEIYELKETLKNSRNAHKYWRKEFLIEYKECLRHKYKRCLAMAQICYKNSVACANYTMPHEKYKHWRRWQTIWSEFAKRSKTNSTAQQGNG